MLVQKMSVDKSLDDKKKRKRWKKLLSDIHEQLKFYFSDANLRKDRFLKQKTESNKDGYVAISVLLSFNKLKELTTDAEMVARAVKKSTFLQVSEDKKHLRRIKPLMPPKYDIDDVTVYVECLPKTVDHSWLQKVFGSCGKVTYVSIPRYKSTGDIKGFAFIEFEKPEEARKACKALNHPPPNVMDKPGKFPKMRKGKAISLDSNPEPYQVQRQRQLMEMEQRLIKEERLENKKYENEADSENKEPESEKKSKRKRSHDEDKSGENVAEAKQKKKCKKQKSEKVDKKLGEVKDEREEERNEDLDEKDGKTLKKQKAKKRKLEDEEKSINQKRKKSHDSDKEVVNDEGKDDDEKLKRKRKRKKNPHKMKDGCQYQLRVIPKTEWLQLKKEYINLQKQSKMQLKHNIMEMELQQKTAIRACLPKKEPISETKSKEPEFTPGTVVRIVSKESIPSRKKLRDYLETIAPIAYLDLEDGDSKGFVRVKTAQGASDVIDRLKVGNEMSAKLLTGEEEKQYWEKLKADRIARLTSKTKGKKKRGADRLMDKAERVLTVASRSHIKFED
ncbi:la-related protein 7-like [Anneissia japonica]|uniref:la-related protein 7-like n=1 Tax=Anneissia japonica TaxID=1529436 RepID=UPI0014255B07|nr:la-related protein 7-like [Anneissia japonica]XP_033097115.1 la-related protein 7-like [Anneissia japonica]XP_033097116.1 la-related protein 7-like [Anneissia japonica]XP_033097117.1 la-related protein 7-like [Anneissia japonica]